MSCNDYVMIRSYVLSQLQNGGYTFNKCCFEYLGFINNIIKGPETKEVFVFGSIFFLSVPTSTYWFMFQTICVFDVHVGVVGVGGWGIGWELDACRGAAANPPQPPPPSPAGASQ